MLRGVLLGLVVPALAACSARQPLLPFPWEALDPEGRELAIVYRPRKGELATVEGRLMASEPEGLYVLVGDVGERRVLVEWFEIRAVLVGEPDRPRLRASIPLRDRKGRLPEALSIARATIETDSVTAADKKVLARLGRFPAGLPPAWRTQPWLTTAEVAALPGPEVPK